jgi:hypothetical protein
VARRRDQPRLRRQATRTAGYHRRDAGHQVAVIICSARMRAMPGPGAAGARSWDQPWAVGWFLAVAERLGRVLAGGRAVGDEPGFQAVEDGLEAELEAAGRPGYRDDV